MFLSWSEADQDKAVAFWVWDAEHCRSCGSKQSQWTDPDGRWLFPPELEAEIVSCPGCVALDAASQAIGKKDRVARARLRPYRLPAQDRAEMTAVDHGAVREVVTRAGTL